MSTRRTALHIGSECLVMRARRLARRLTRIYDEELRGLGIGSAQLNLLVTIGAAGPLRASEIGDHLDIEKSTLSRTLGRLHAEGLIEAEQPGGAAPVGAALAALRLRRFRFGPGASRWRRPCR